jgi:hypothetical protein
MIQLMQADGNGADLDPEEKRLLAPVRPYELLEEDEFGCWYIVRRCCYMG